MLESHVKINGYIPKLFVSANKTHDILEWICQKVGIQSDVAFKGELRSVAIDHGQVEVFDGDQSMTLCAFVEDEEQASERAGIDDIEVTSLGHDFFCVKVKKKIITIPLSQDDAERIAACLKFCKDVRAQDMLENLHHPHKLFQKQTT